jgi:hypothetical protein
MATAFGEFTAEEQRSIVGFCGQKDSMQRIFVKKYFLFMMGSVCRVKRFHLRGKRFAYDEEVEREIRKWLRRKSKDFYVAGFDALVKRWVKCINVGGGHVEKCFFPGSNITCFTFYVYIRL